MGMTDPRPDHTCVCVVCEQSRHELETSRLREAVRILGRQLDWTPTNDPRLTCLVCGAEGCTHEIRTRHAGQTSWYGAHGSCLNMKPIEVRAGGRTVGIVQHFDIRPGIDEGAHVHEMTGLAPSWCEQWLRDHADETTPYAGRLVAVAEGIGIVAVGDNLDAVRADLALAGFSRHDVMYTRIPVKT